jgi:protein-arginine kinase activator protein McsA
VAPRFSVPLTCENCETVWFSRANWGRWCKPCRLARNKVQTITWAKENRGPYGGWSTPEEAREYQRAWRLKKHFGMTIPEWEAMAEAQGYLCAICNARPERLHTDHCHSSGKVRGLVCGPCNRAIGLLGDTADSVQRAVTYLREAEERIA